MPLRQTAPSLTEFAPARGLPGKSHFSWEIRKHFAATPATDRVGP